MYALHLRYIPCGLREMHLPWTKNQQINGRTDKLTPICPKKYKGEGISILLLKISHNCFYGGNKRAMMALYQTIQYMGTGLKHKTPNKD